MIFPCPIANAQALYHQQLVGHDITHTSI